MTWAQLAYDEIVLFADSLTAQSFSNYERVKLFRQFLQLVGEYASSMTMLDVLDKMERFEIIVHSHAWLDCINLRNTLTHEYPL
ncbi:MAG: hypothetical protein R8L53_09170 [Mariprofundales bacterium]